MTSILLLCRLIRSPFLFLAKDVKSTSTRPISLVTIATQHAPLLEANPALTEPLKDQMYVDNVVFTTGIADAGDFYVVASGEADLACRITHIAKTAFDPPA